MTAAEPAAVLWNSRGESTSGTLNEQRLQAPDLWQASLIRAGKRPARPAFWVHLAGGGRLGAKGLRWDNEVIHFQPSVGGRELKLDVGQVAGIQPLRSRASWRSDDSEWSRVSSSRDPEDLVILRNGDRQTGELKELSDDALTLGGQLGDRKIAWEDMIGIRMNPELAELPASGQDRWVVQFQDESWCFASQLIPEEENWTVKLSNTIPLSCSPEELTWLAPLSPRQVPLSRFPIHKQSHQPLWGEATTAVINSNLLGLPLRSPPSRDLPEMSPLGLGLTSGMSITWKLDRKFQRLACQLGMDVSCGDEARAVVRFRDGMSQMDEFALQKGLPPQRVHLPLEQVQNLTIEVDFGLHGDAGDLVDLLHPVLFAIDP